MTVKADYVTGYDGRQRCAWCGSDPLYIAYHDDEWGRPALDDRRQFEFLTLESAQAGLSWITILRKREAYRAAYADFNPDIVASWGETEVEKLLTDTGIVRNRLKIRSSISNAGHFLDISEKYGSFSAWLLEFYDGAIRTNHWNRMDEVPVTTETAQTIAREMKSMGFRFFGPVIAYAHLQATGIVNDHLTGCCSRK